MIDTLIKAIMQAYLQAKAAPEATDDVFKRAPVWRICSKMQA